MKAGLFWFGELTDEVRLAVDLCRLPERSPFEKIHLYTRSEYNGSRPIRIAHNDAAYPAINALRYAYEEGARHGLDFAVLNFGSGIFLSLTKLHTLLSEPNVQGAMLSFRIANVVMRAGTSSPRLPFVDDHFVVLNVVRAAARELFCRRKLIQSSHFAHAGGNHAVLLSFIEYSLSKRDWCNYFAADRAYDEYGRSRGLAPMPFLICAKTGFATCYPALRPSSRMLLACNVARTNPGADALACRYAGNAHPGRVVATDGFYFFQPRDFLTRKWKRMAGWFNRNSNFQYQRKDSRFAPSPSKGPGV